jgi:excisionase family DNA binding protein
MSTLESNTSVYKMPERTLTTSQAAEFLGISKKTLLKYCRSRQISFLKYPGGDFRFRETTLDIFMRRCTIPSSLEASAGSDRMAA